MDHSYIFLQLLRGRYSAKAIAKEQLDLWDPHIECSRGDDAHIRLSYYP